MQMKPRILAAAALAVLLMTGSAVAQQKVIKDPTEYSAYIAALNLADPAKKAAAMEDFLKKYPGSVVKIDALEQAMAAYQQAGNAVQVEAVAKRILQLQSGNMRALAIVTMLERMRATQGDAQALANMRGHTEQGLRGLPGWRKPEGVSDAEFAKLKNQMTAIFNGAAGFAALQGKDYAKAREAYLEAAKVDPSNMQDIYQLSIAELEMSPLDRNGFWHIGKAIGLAQAQKNAAAVQSMITYGKAKYRKYHGGEDGWEQIVARAAKENSLPANFAAGITPAPSPAEIAVKAVQENDPSELSFSDWEYVLGYRDASPANKDAAEKVWKTIQEKQRNGAALLRIPVKVISATPDAIDAAITDENQSASKADLHVVMAKRLDNPPAAGSMISVTGLITRYVTNPVKFEMERGAL